MPAGFYWDGIMMMILGLIGLTGSLFMHLFIVRGWRERVKAMKEVNDDSEEARNSTKDEDSLEASDESEIDEEATEDDDVESEDTEDEFEDSEEEMDEDSDEEDDEIDIGSRIGLAFEDEEVFGTIIEFDDEEETVTIEEDGTGDLITGYQEDMFLE